MERVTKDFLLDKGFIHVPSIIQESFMYVLEDVDEEDPWQPGKRYRHFKAISISGCNDKGEGEYYLFMREGVTADRTKDDVVSLSRNLMYQEEVLDFLRLLGA